MGLYVQGDSIVCALMFPLCQIFIGAILFICFQQEQQFGITKIHYKRIPKTLPAASRQNLLLLIQNDHETVGKCLAALFFLVHLPEALFGVPDAPALANRSTEAYIRCGRNVYKRLAEAVGRVTSDGILSRGFRLLHFEWYSVTTPDLFRMYLFWQ